MYLSYASRFSELDRRLDVLVAFCNTAAGQSCAMREYTRHTAVLHPYRLWMIWTGARSMFC